MKISIILIALFFGGLTVFADGFTAGLEKSRLNYILANPPSAKKKIKIKTLITADTCASHIEVVQDFYMGYTFHTLVIGQYILTERVGPQEPLINAIELQKLNSAKSNRKEVTLYFGVDGRIEVELSEIDCEQ